MFPIPSPKIITRVPSLLPLQPFQQQGTKSHRELQALRAPPTPLRMVDLQHREPRNHLCPSTRSFQQHGDVSALSLTPAGSEQTNSSQEEEDGFDVLHERKIRGKRLSSTPEMAAGAVLPAARTQQAGSHQRRIPRLPKEEGEREEKRSSETHTTASFMGAGFVQQGSCVWLGAPGN